jgi:uncharacterized protein YbjT (DUF2867 family)
VTVRTGTVPVRPVPAVRTGAGPAPDAPRRALVAGASGLVGSHLLALLRAEPTYARVELLLRRPLPEALRAGPADRAVLVEHVVDFGALARWAAFPAVDDVYVCLGTTIRSAGSEEAFRRVDFDAVIATARVAQRRGASRLAVVSALGADPGSRVFYNRVKGETEAELARLDYASMTVLRPSLLDGARAERRPGERIALAIARPAGRLIPPRWRPIHAATVARCMRDAVLRAEPGLRILESDAIQRDAG